MTVLDVDAEIVLRLDSRPRLLGELVTWVVRSSRTPLSKREVIDESQRLLEKANTYVNSRDLDNACVGILAEDIQTDGLGRFYSSSIDSLTASRVLQHLERAQAAAERIAEEDWPDTDLQTKALEGLLASEPPSAEEEARLAWKVANGDRQARTTLIVRNLRLVWHMAKQYKWRETPAYDRDDLFQEGCLGLFRAIDKFDPARGYKLSTYATNWIRQSIQRAAADKSRVIRLPAHVDVEVVKIGHQSSKFEAKAGRSASDEEISKLADIDMERVKWLRQVSRPVSSLEDNDALDRVTNFVAEEELAIQAADSERFRKLMARVLSVYELDLLRLRFGLDGEGPMTLDEIGKSMGVTRERVRQIVDQILTKLRGEIERLGGWPV